MHLYRVKLDGTGLTLLDRESGRSLTIRADNVINATGVWADRIRPDELHAEADVPQITPSRGTHITLSLDDLPLRAGAIVPARPGQPSFRVGRAAGPTHRNVAG